MSWVWIQKGFFKEIRDCSTFHLTNFHWNAAEELRLLPPSSPFFSLLLPLFHFSVCFLVHSGCLQSLSKMFRMQGVVYVTVKMRHAFSKGSHLNGINQNPYSLQIHTRCVFFVFFGKPVQNFVLFFFFFFQIWACFFKKSIVITPGLLSFTCAASRSSPTVYVSSSASHSIPVFPPHASVSRVIQPFGERLCCFTVNAGSAAHSDQSVLRAYGKYW